EGEDHVRALRAPADELRVNWIERVDALETLASAHRDLDRVPAGGLERRLEARAGGGELAVGDHERAPGAEPADPTTELRESALADHDRVGALAQPHLHLLQYRLAPRRAARLALKHGH